MFKNYKFIQIDNLIPKLSENIKLINSQNEYWNHSMGKKALKDDWQVNILFDNILVPLNNFRKEINLESPEIELINETYFVILWYFELIEKCSEEDDDWSDNKFIDDFIFCFPELDRITRYKEK